MKLHRIEIIQIVSLIQYNFTLDTLNIRKMNRKSKVKKEVLHNQWFLFEYWTILISCLLFFNCFLF